MKQRIWLFKRGKTFYVQDSATGQQKSLGTTDRGEANRLLAFKIESLSDTGFRQRLLKLCFSQTDPKLATRTWQVVMDQMASNGKESTRARCRRAFKSPWFDGLRGIKIAETTAENFLLILNSCPPSVNHYLRRLHNLALGLGWLVSPVLASRCWPEISFREKRAITRAEHEQILSVEKNRERNLFYQFLWETGASQSDAAQICAEQIGHEGRTVSFIRNKTGSQAHLVIGQSLRRLLDELPKQGPLFPSIIKTNANDRAAEFYRRCKLLEIQGISLHSYRYAWAERAKRAGYPERFAQEALGHNSNSRSKITPRGE